MYSFIENNKAPIDSTQCFANYCSPDTSAVPYRTPIWGWVMHFSNLIYKKIFDGGSYHARKKEQH